MLENVKIMLDLFFDLTYMLGSCPSDHIQGSAERFTHRKTVTKITPEGE